MQDDYLGIWGDSALTGKSSESDLVAGKKTLPVSVRAGKEWDVCTALGSKGRSVPMRLITLSEQLAEEGAKLYTQEAADQMTDLALQSLRAADPQGEAGEALFELANVLLNRQA